MKKIYSILLILFIASLYFCNVNREPLKPNQENQAAHYLTFIDNHCQGNSGSLAKGLSSSVHLVKYSLNEDTLTLRIHYEANCCPAFVTEATVSQGNIVINIADTLRNCKCMCDYENDFKFLYEYKGDLWILFKWWDINHESLSTYMDTTIVIN